MVIDSENYHALQLLLHLYAGQVDCIYIDPPYNSGATDWKYNNKYIAEEDAYRHSKWLSMMEKRLKLARRLLKPTGSLIVTIDENELHHLYIMLEQEFRDMTIQMVSIIINRSGAGSRYIRRVEEQALFGFMPSSNPWVGLDLLFDKKTKKSPWEGLIRGGTQWTCSKRPNLVYPIAIDPQTLSIVGTGATLGSRLESRQLGSRFTKNSDLDEWTPDPNETYNGFPVVWPWRSGDKLGIWRLSSDRLKELSHKGYVQVREKRSGAEQKRLYTVNYLLPATIADIENGKIQIDGRDSDTGSVLLKSVLPSQKAKTVWNRPEHSTQYGSEILDELIGGGKFGYPKSLYAVRDTLLLIVKENPDALILDFFAGSGTTLHATLLLNEADGGRRRCILVTNNEIGPQNEKRLMREGVSPESPEWKQLGIFESVTRPRVEAAIKGVRADGTKLDRKYTYADDKPMAEGFEANADFLRLRHLDPVSIVAERDFDALHPMLWAMSGAVGSCPTVKVGSVEDHEPGYLMPGGAAIPAGCRYAVLLRESRFSRFAHELEQHPQITHVWLQAHSQESLVEMRAELLPSLRVSWLFRDLYRYFDREQGAGG